MNNNVNNEYTSTDPSIRSGASTERRRYKEAKKCSNLDIEDIRPEIPKLKLDQITNQNQNVRPKISEPVNPQCNLEQQKRISQNQRGHNLPMHPIHQKPVDKKNRRGSSLDKPPSIPPLQLQRGQPVQAIIDKSAVSNKHTQRSSNLNNGTGRNLPGSIDKNDCQPDLNTSSFIAELDTSLQKWKFFVLIALSVIVFIILNQFSDLLGQKVYTWILFK